MPRSGEVGKAAAHEFFLRGGAGVGQGFGQSGPGLARAGRYLAAAPSKARACARPARSPSDRTPPTLGARQATPPPRRRSSNWPCTTSALAQTRWPSRCAAVSAIACSTSRRPASARPSSARCARAGCAAGRPSKGSACSAGAVDGGLVQSRASCSWLVRTASSGASQSGRRCPAGAWRRASW